jgi:hypothetical protein
MGWLDVPHRHAVPRRDVERAFWCIPIHMCVEREGVLTSGIAEAVVACTSTVALVYAEPGPWAGSAVTQEGVLLPALVRRRGVFSGSRRAVTWQAGNGAHIMTQGWQRWSCHGLFLGKQQALAPENDQQVQGAVVAPAPGCLVEAAAAAPSPVHGGAAAAAALQLATSAGAVCATALAWLQHSKAEDRRW